MIIDKVKKLALEECSKDSWDWESHLRGVVKYSLILCDKLGSDKEILEIAAWLHDIEKIKDINVSLHHVKGSETAVKILKEENYPKEKIEVVRQCILTHSSDENYPPETKEQKILASADALCHFDNILNLLHAYFALGKCSVKEGKEKLIKKLDKIMKKASLLPEAKKIATERYAIIKEALNL
jgi:uncharacterized protein